MLIIMSEDSMAVVSTSSSNISSSIIISVVEEYLRSFWKFEGEVRKRICRYSVMLNMMKTATARAVAPKILFVYIFMTVVLFEKV